MFTLTVCLSFIPQAKSFLALYTGWLRLCAQTVCNHHPVYIKRKKIMKLMSIVEL